MNVRGWLSHAEKLLLRPPHSFVRLCGPSSLIPALGTAQPDHMHGHLAPREDRRGLPPWGGPSEGPPPAPSPTRTSPSARPPAGTVPQPPSVLPLTFPPRAIPRTWPRSLFPSSRQESLGRGHPRATFRSSQARSVWTGSALVWVFRG